MGWGRTSIAGPVSNGADGVVNGQAQQSERRLVNVLATGSVDQVLWRKPNYKVTSR